jgi:hypothetical protein
LPIQNYRKNARTTRNPEETTFKTTFYYDMTSSISLSVELHFKRELKSDLNGNRRLARKERFEKKEKL